MKNISICIVGKNQGPFLQKCIQSCLAIGGAGIVYVDLGSADDSKEIAARNGVPALESTEGQELPAGLEEKLKSEWILFLRPDERIVSKTGLNTKALHGSKEGAFSLLVKTALASEKMEDLRWIKIPGRENRYAPEALKVTRLEIRLVRRRHLSSAFSLLRSVPSGKTFSFATGIFFDLEVQSLQMEMRREEKDPAGKKELEMRFLRGERSIDAEEDYGMWELGERFISFNILRKNDLARYHRGLAAGFGSEPMYDSMLHNEIRSGRFDGARHFFEAWQEKWGEFDTPKPYKTAGIIYLHLFQFEKAAAFLKQYVDRAQRKDVGEAHDLLGKALILMGKKDEALVHFSEARACGVDMDLKLIRTIEAPNWNPLKLTLCLIARDEEATIARALDSATGVADEIIVVDTGSTDGTKEIARRYRARVIEVPWEDDFSKIRNEGLAHATGDYILWLDADEYIDPKEKLKLALLKVILPPGRDVAFRIKIDSEDEDEEMAVMMHLPKMDEPIFAVRLFPSRPGVHYEGFAFESADRSLAASGIARVDDEIFKITHSRKDRRRRELRKVNAIQKLYGEEPDPATALKAAMVHLKLGDIQIASQWLEHARIGHPRLWMKIVTLYCRFGRSSEVSGIIRKLLREFPDSLELSLAGAELHFSEGNYPAVYEALEPKLDSIGRGMGREDRACAAYLCGMALLESGNPARGIDFLCEARELDSWNMRYKIGGLYALARLEEWESFIPALAAILKEECLPTAEVIRDFGDLGVVLQLLARHFESNRRMEPAGLCHKIVLQIAESKLHNPESITKMIRSLDPAKECAQHG